MLSALKMWSFFHSAHFSVTCSMRGSTPVVWAAGLVYPQRKQNTESCVYLRIMYCVDSALGKALNLSKLFPHL